MKAVFMTNNLTRGIAGVVIVPRDSRMRWQANYSPTGGQEEQG
jgi:hypothetical protein